MFARTISFAFAAALLGGVAFLPQSASAGPVGVVELSPKASNVQLAGYYERRRWWRRDGDNVRVRAPFTSVDDSPRGTAVEAPFTSVQTNGRGTWVRAPFVNLFVPRD
ncbi:MAG: hypothetical protein FJX44_02835 [Alphaproteobacteria bacterium]|nr:hypothetical protein [Alphaproteobacteria bacterium]